MFFFIFSRASSGVVLTSKTRMDSDNMLETVTSAGFIFFFGNLIRFALMKIPMYSFAYFMSNASALCEDISFDDC